MPQQVLSSVENNFTKGLLTEFTGLNFPENAATDTDNCSYNLIGDVARRGGLDYEYHYAAQPFNGSFQAKNSYKWNNVSGDGTTQFMVVQIGQYLRFFAVSAAVVGVPISQLILNSYVDMAQFTINGSTVDANVYENECQFAEGNGYLIVYHPYLDPFYCSYNKTTDVITPTRISVQIRDFNGVYDSGLAVNDRPTTLPGTHLYNLINQGWTQGSTWIADSGSPQFATLGSKNFATTAGLPIHLGDYVNITTDGPPPGDPYQSLPNGSLIMSGTVTGYAGTTLTINVTNVSPNTTTPTFGYNFWKLTPTNVGYVQDWFTAIGNYPSNADVWWYFKNAAGTFNPGTTYNNVTLNSGPAPRGKSILEAFNQDRSLLTGIPALTAVTSATRPRTGCWFQGRVWYTGVDSSVANAGTSGSYAWTENIYFSQIIVDTTQFGLCYQTNDPTSQDLFELLPTDGGVIQIQGCGSIYKLFPIQNGMLVFAANGVWFITGSQGIGFSATDYTITKISSVRSISSTSFVDVLGLPYFWNEEDIYKITPSQGGALTVEPITVSTILSFYSDIPYQNKKYVRGCYDPINYNIQWLYKSDLEDNFNDRYFFDKILNYNTYNKAFYPYSIPADPGLPQIAGINYVTYAGRNDSPDPQVKYLTFYLNNNLTFSDEKEDEFTDWTVQTGGISYESYFVTGYKIRGQAQKRFQPTYVYMYSNNDVPTTYKVQGIWDYANDRNSNRYSVPQVATINRPYVSVVNKRHKIRGHGLALQLKVSSIDDNPFHIIGWSIMDTVNQNV